MKRMPVVLVFAYALLLTGQARAESWSMRLTRGKTGDFFAIKVDRLTEADLGEFLQFHVTVKLKDSKELPVRSRELRIFNGKEFVSSCQVQPTGKDGERVFSFRVAARYAEKSTFTYADSDDFNHMGYWFYLKDFVESK